MKSEFTVFSEVSFLQNLNLSSKFSVGHFGPTEMELLSDLGVLVSVNVRGPTEFREVCTLETTFLTQFSPNLLRMFALTQSRPSFILGHVGSKNRSLGQVFGKA